MAAGNEIMVFRKNDYVAIGFGDDKLVNIFIIIMNNIICFTNTLKKSKKIIHLNNLAQCLAENR